MVSAKLTPLNNIARLTGQRSVEILDCKKSEPDNLRIQVGKGSLQKLDIRRCKEIDVYFHPG